MRSRFAMGIKKTVEDSSQKKKKQSSASPPKLPFPSDCFCCSNYSRESDDKKLAETALELAPPSEWHLHWEPDQLMAETGSTQITSFFILRDIFMFLPIHLDTLLAVAATCRSWRILCDRLPHWRYLLPMRNEVVPIVVAMRWHEPPVFEREYFTWSVEEGGDGSRHYRIKLTEQWKSKARRARGLNSSYEAISRSGADDDNCCHFGSCKCCSDSDDLCGSCGCSSCNCSSDEDRQEESKALNKRTNKFQLLYNKREHLVDCRDDSEAELAHVAFQRQPRAVDWMRRLQVRRLHRQIFTPQHLHRQQQQQQQQQGGGRSGPDEDDDDDDDDDGDDGEASAAARLRKKAASAHPGRRQVRHRRRISEDGDDDDDDDYDGDLDADTDGTDDSADTNPFRIPVPVTSAATAAASSSSSSPNEPTDDGDDDNNGDGGEDDGQEGAMMGAPQVSLDPQNPQTHTITKITGLLAAKKLPKEDEKFLIHNQIRYTSYAQDAIIRVKHGTLLGNAVEMMSGVRYRRDWMFPSLSSFIDAVEHVLKGHRKHVVATNPCEKYGPLISFSVFSFLWLAMCLTMTALLGLYYDKTVFKNGCDNTLATIFSVIVAVCSLLWALVHFNCVDTQFESYPHTKPASATKGHAMLWLTFALSMFAVPLGLLTARVRTAERLLDAGTVSVCDAWSPVSTDTSSSTTDYINSWGKDLLQCELQSKFLPTKLAAATFAYFPPNTKILWNPPSASRSVLFSSTRPTNTSSTCTVSRNVLYGSEDDAGYNMSKHDVQRGRPGYYTVILPSSCVSSSSSGISNVTVLIISDSAECPFWSKSYQNGSDAAAAIHPRFDQVLSQNSAIDAVQTANSISVDLGQKVGNPPSSAAPPCAAAANAMVTTTTSTTSGYKFFLRVSAGFDEHWSSYYIPGRMPFETGQFKYRNRWVQTRDYTLNGIVALMADSSMFLAHENSASPVVPEQIEHVFRGSWNRLSSTTAPPDDGVTEAPFWTGAHPMGLRKLRGDFYRGAIALATVIVGIFLVMVVWGVVSRGWSRYIFLFSSLITFALVALPVPLLIQSAICLANVPAQDARELTQPVVCLTTSHEDAVGPLIFSAVLVGISMIGLCCGVAIGCTESGFCEECCDDCCDKLDDCCDWCGENCCCECCTDCCDRCERICDTCCQECDDCCEDDCCCCCSDCDDCCDTCCDDCCSPMCRKLSKCCCCESD